MKTQIEVTSIRETGGWIARTLAGQDRIPSCLEIQSYASVEECGEEGAKAKAVERLQQGLYDLGIDVEPHVLVGATGNKYGEVSVHNNAHPMAGKRAMLNERASDPGREMVEAGLEIEVGDWVDRVFEDSWMVQNTNPACLQYAIRAEMTALTMDDEAVYAKIDGLGHIIHVSEIGPPIEGIRDAE